MSSMTRLDAQKLRTRKIIATAALTVVTIALLVLSDTSASASAAPPAAEPSYQVAGEQVRSGRAEAARPAGGQISSDPAALDQEMDTVSTARPVRPQEQ